VVAEVVTVMIEDEQVLVIIWVAGQAPLAGV